MKKVSKTQKVKRRRKCVLLLLLCLLCVGLAQPWMILQDAKPPPMMGARGLFSWSSDRLTRQGREELFALMVQEELDAVYQSFSPNTSFAELYAFLEDAAQRGIDVWLLTGQPEWGMDETGQAMLDEIRRVADWNESLPAELRFRGILMDCEPYLTEQWDSDPAQVMDSWCAAMANARAAANKENLLFAACIPYYLDTLGFTAPLTQMIETGCDALAIMNYYKKNEAEHIETEVAIAAKAGVPVTVIYELQQPGIHGLQEINTYYHDGLDAVEHSWNALRAWFGKKKPATIAFHEYKALREVLSNE